jgi:hypothetical protein
MPFPDASDAISITTTLSGRNRRRRLPLASGAVQPFREIRLKIA